MDRYLGFPVLVSKHRFSSSAHWEQNAQNPNIHTFCHCKKSERYLLGEKALKAIEEGKRQDKGRTLYGDGE